MFRIPRISFMVNNALLASHRALHIQKYMKTLQQPVACHPVLSHSKPFSTTSKLSHGHLTPPKPGEELKITFILKDGSQRTYEVAEGDSLLDIAQANNLEMEGACGGSCACSTCHVIVDPDYFDALPEPDDDENDMLDLAYGLTETSRLGCQIKMSKDIDGIRVALPAMTRNVNASDFD
ncbi:mitochondrial matrix iron-sulfur protein [Zygosaccharomyces mellis]|uniref:Mitochondrial matrix iron-sulfur protein n=1 Tax=Zygosaccharomyces mellis TaxID=42258 RepID=A0A4C2E4Q2_9SACH|nr:mitochondrial matrix iron-sulfur protein [Zygosaccharomyces mellis]